MILDTDNEILESVNDLNKLVIENTFHNSYENDVVRDHFSVVEGAFKIVFEKPQTVRVSNNKYLLYEQTVIVCFYRYEYEQMLKEGNVISGRNKDGSLIEEPKLIWKTINNFNFKLRSLGYYKIKDIREMKYKLFPA